MIALKSMAVWLLILVLAMANGLLREGVLLRMLPRAPAYVVSGLLLMACVLFMALLSIKWLGARSLLQCVSIGLFWLALTLVFEFGFGLVVRGQELGVVLDAYRFKDGNIWPLVLVVVALAPTLAAWARGLLHGPGTLQQ